MTLQNAIDVADNILGDPWCVAALVQASRLQSEWLILCQSRATLEWKATCVYIGKDCTLDMVVKGITEAWQRYKKPITAIRAKCLELDYQPYRLQELLAASKAACAAMEFNHSL